MLGWQDTRVAQLTDGLRGQAQRSIFGMLVVGYGPLGLRASHQGPMKRPAPDLNQPSDVGRTPRVSCAPL